MTQYYFCIFLNRHSKTFASGVSRYTRGRYGVIVKKILKTQCKFCNGTHPEEACNYGTWGAYSLHQYYPDNCGPWAFAYGPTPELAKKAASGQFQIQVGPWSECKDLTSLNCAVRYRYHGGSE